MKKYAALLLFALFLNGCDDGDLTVDTIDFSSIETSQACDASTNALVYKLKTQEALLLQMPAGSYRNESDSTYTYTIDSKGSGSYRVVYRAFDGTVATTNICGTIPPSTPKVNEEWIGTDGVIEITSKAVIDSDTDAGTTRITGYTHSIVFKNITFNKPSGIQTNEEFKFGNFKTPLSSPLNLTFPAAFLECSYMKGIYNYNSTSYLSIENIDPALIVNTPTPANEPRIGYIEANKNQVFYRTSKTGTGTFTPEAICVEKQSTPTVDQKWEGQIGITGESGIIEVTTTKTAQIYTHTVVLRNVIFQKGNKKNTFKLGKSFLLGTITKTE